MKYKKGDIVKVTKSPNEWSDIPKGLVTEILRDSLSTPYARVKKGSEVWVEIKSLAGTRYGWLTFNLRKATEKALRFQYKMSGPFVDDES